MLMSTRGVQSLGLEVRDWSWVPVAGFKALLRKRVGKPASFLRLGQLRHHQQQTPAAFSPSLSLHRSVLI